VIAVAIHSNISSIPQGAALATDSFMLCFWSKESLMFFIVDMRDGG
jgi:hypothetical protein